MKKSSFGLKFKIFSQIRNNYILRFNYMKFFITCFLISLSIKSAAQIDIECLKLTDNKRNLFYAGVDNPIKVHMNNPLDNYTISTIGAGSSLSKVGKGEYMIWVTTVDTCSIIISQNQKEVFRKIFISNVIPNPVASLRGMHDTTVKRNWILANPSLSVIFPNCYYQHGFQIISFQAVFIEAGDSTFTVTNGNLLSSEQLKLVNRQISGNTIYFNEIRGTGTDSRTIKLPSFWIKIE
jgi:hypothetical protein